MKKHLSRAFVVATLALAVTAALQAKTIWIDKNIYSSGENLQVGDVIAVQIDDISQMRFNLSLADNNTASISSNPDANITGFLPKVNANRKINSSGKTEVSGKNTLRVQVGARVARRLPDGKFEINGTREYSFNGSASRLTVSGVIDPGAVKGRTVLSKDIANFRMEVRGFKEAAGMDITRPPLKENENASGSLTEEEKQRIIVDYLNKMLRELSR